MDGYIDATKGETEGKKDCILEITTLNNKITKARELLLMGDLDATDIKPSKMKVNIK